MFYRPVGPKTEFNQVRRRGASWLNIAASFQRILERRGSEGSHPKSSAEIIIRLEHRAEGWNRHPVWLRSGG